VVALLYVGCQTHNAGFDVIVDEMLGQFLSSINKDVDAFGL
jgi:hypothetical protein